jgi:hypothetical protein
VHTAEIQIWQSAERRSELIVFWTDKIPLARDFILLYNVRVKPRGRNMAIKKTTKKTATKRTMAVRPAPVAAAPTPCNCGCRCGGFWKKLIMFIIVFALGFAACHFMCCCKKDFYGKHMGKDMFVEGCLDLSKIKRPGMLEKITAADANADGCITKAELKAQWKEMRHERFED